MKWDSRKEEKGKHGKFQNLWKGPYIIHAYRGNNAFLIKDMDGADLPDGPVNGRMLKHYFSLDQKQFSLKFIVNIILFSTLMSG